MKLITGLCLGMALSVSAMAQDAHEGSMKFKNEDRNGVMAEYNAPKDQTEDALAKKLDEASLGKRHSESGYWKYEGVSWPAISPDKVDVYFNVDRHKGSSVVYMMVSTGYGNFVTSASNPQIVSNMQIFLNRFRDDLVTYQQQVALAEQQKAVEEADKKLKHADHETDRATRRQKEATKEKNKRQQQAEAEQQKLDELPKPQPANGK